MSATPARSATPEPALQVHELDHRYSAQAPPILEQLSLCMAPGESVALVGRSGSGKSTLLNLLSGLEPVQQGLIKVAGQPLANLSDRQRTRLRRHHIGFVYQSFNLIPTLSVGDNITLPLVLAGMGRQGRIERQRQLLDEIGLQSRGNDFPDRLSGGEQQRVAIARAIAHCPALLLADEPTGNLDVDTGGRVMGLLTGLVREQGTTLLLVTHSREVARVADRILLMRDGHLSPLQAGHEGTAW